MIVQRASDNQTAFVIRQQDHAEVCGVFAEHFGNDEFEALHPRDAMVFVTRHHDDGWQDIDDNPTLDPNTGYIYHLTQTAMPLLVATGNKSPDVNQAYHAYSGIISSMHTYGLYHGRYGLSDKVYIDMVSDEWREKVQKMLSIELERQENIKASYEDKALLADDVLFHNYKLLQFFDTLALYIQTVCPEQVSDTQFMNVPRAVGDDVTVSATHIEPNVISLSPWVFDVDEFTVNTQGRIMTPLAVDKADQLPEIFASTPVTSQTYTFRRD